MGLEWHVEDQTVRGGARGVNIPLDGSCPRSCRDVEMDRKRGGLASCTHHWLQKFMVR